MTRRELADDACGYCHGVGYLQRLRRDRQGYLTTSGTSRVKCLQCDGTGRRP